MKTKILYLAVLTTFLISCSSTKNSLTVRTQEISGSGVIQIPVVVDLEVKDTKVTGSYTMSNQGSQIDYIKGKAVGVALQSVKADVLIEPVYEIKEETGVIIVTVTGFPATYKNFRSISKEDIPLIQVGATKVATVVEEVMPVKN